MKMRRIWAVALLFVSIGLTVPVAGQLTQFASRADFDAACQNTVLEDFEDIEFAGLAVFEAEFVDENTDIFLDQSIGGLRIEPGDIVSGLTITSTNVAAPPTRFALANTITPSGNSLGPSSGVDSSILEFSQPVDCLGLDLFSPAILNGPGSFEVSYFDSTGMSLGSVMVAEVDADNGVFAGVMATGSIGISRMEITSELSIANTGAVGELLDNIAFRTVPEPSAISLCLLPVFLLTRRRSRR